MEMKMRSPISGCEPWHHEHQWLFLPRGRRKQPLSSGTRWVMANIHTISRHRNFHKSSRFLSTLSGWKYGPIVTVRVSISHFNWVMSNDGDWRHHSRLTSTLTLLTLLRTGFPIPGENIDQDWGIIMYWNKGVLSSRQLFNYFSILFSSFCLLKTLIVLSIFLQNILPGWYHSAPGGGWFFPDEISLLARLYSEHWSAHNWHLYLSVYSIFHLSI